ENVEAYREANREAVNVLRAAAVDGHSKNRRDEEERQDRLEKEGSAEAEQLGVLFPSKSRAKLGHRDSRLGKELLEEEGRDGGSRQLRNDVGDARAELYPPRGRHGARDRRVDMAAGDVSGGINCHGEGKAMGER